MGIVESLEREVAAKLRGFGIAPGDFILAAFSAGPDSTALALALSRLLPDFGFRLELGYVDHGLRPVAEIEAEIEAARASAARMGAPLAILELGRGAVEKLAAEKKCGIEAAARELRYRALAGKLPESERAFLALGHTLSDQAETMVARFLSGSGIRGLKGIPASAKRPVGLGPEEGLRVLRIIRPLMDLEKREILDYLAARGSSWSTDSTNEGEAYQRNRLRRGLMPGIREIFPGYLRSLRTLHKKLSAVDDFLDRGTEGLFIKYGREWRADAAAFYELHEALRQRAVERVLADLAPGRRIPFGFIEDCGRAREGAEGLRRRPLRGCGLSLSLRGKQIILRERLAHAPKKGYFFLIPRGGGRRAAEGLEFELFEGDNREEGPALASFSFPLVLRSVRAGDKLTIRGGTKLVNDLLSEWGVPDQERAAIPVLEDEDGLVCVLGKPLGYRNRFAERGRRPPLEGERCMQLKVESKGGVNGR